ALCLAAGALAPTGAQAAVQRQSASAGSVKATFTFTETHGRYSLPEYGEEKLAIERAGRPAYEAPVSSSLCSGACWPGGSLLGRGSSSVQVLALEAPSEPDVLLNLFTGGAHCCSVTQAFSYDGASATYVKAEHDFGNVPARLERPGPGSGSGSAERLVSADNRFAYAFTDFADSGLPVQVWTLSAGRFVDVTRSYPALIARDARRQWHGFLADRNNGVGLIAAWAADECLLGHRAKVERMLARQLRAGRLQSAFGAYRGRRFIHALMADLKRWGYLHR
ncbi:MAG: hypothetical protein KGJ43_05775, partial [Acidobacteriota bacterium]|nr:hypothetical protein [Acidobacteriota bacterium]